MQQIVNSSSIPTDIGANNTDNDTIVYNFVGNFVPPEWFDLRTSCGKILSKTARQLLSLIVFRLQVYHDNNIDELQESYYFFEQELKLCQRRIRQCMLELQDGGFIHLYLATIVKHKIKCRNTPCIKLAKNFQHYTKKFFGKSEDNFGSTRKNFQPDNIIDNNNKYNKSRSSESVVLKNVVDKDDPGLDYTQNQLQEKSLQPEEMQIEERIDEAKDIVEGAVLGAVPLCTALTKLTEKFFVTTELVTSNSSKAKVSDNSKPDNNKGWFKRKKLVDFYPLIEEDADLLQLRSNREFNLAFINKLLLKLAEQYPNHHFCNKKVVLNYMAKTLAYELRDSSKVNHDNFQFKSNDENTLKKRYLKKIKNSTNTGRHAKLKRKLAGVFDHDIAYELLTSCAFGSVMQDEQYQIKLLKDISLSEHIKAKILEQVQAVYGHKVKQLQIIPFTPTMMAKQQAKREKVLADGEKPYMPELSPDLVWDRIRRSLIASYGVTVDQVIFSKLTVIEEDRINKRVILKPQTDFIIYMITRSYRNILESAFQAEGFTYELLAVDRSN
ncbi:MAG: hypothetical protein LN568_05695 [Rickettsia endosymbiont of Pseudomimeciton antennatum]|nr:hypothetical protein [Rickettsia endosymbiont of Pseudomimeciton antennatum]